MKKTALFLASAISFIAGCGDNTSTGPGTATTFTLTTTQTSLAGTITRSPDKTEYSNGDTVKIVVRPNTGYTFSGWSGDTVTTSDTLVVIMKSSKTFYADFVNGTSGKKVYTVTTSATNGSITLTPVGGVYDSGTVVTFKPVPDYGYLFSSWSGALTGSDTAATLTVTANSNVTANFRVDPNAKYVTLTISPAVSNGTLTLEPAGTVNGNIHTYIPGTSVRITAVADSGYTISAWLGTFSNVPVKSSFFSFAFTVNQTGSVSFAKISH